MTGLDAVCFDLDGTLCVGEQDADRLLAAAFDEAGLEQCFEAAALDAVDTAALPTAHSDREFFEHFFRAGADLAGADAEPAAIDAVAAAYLDRLDPTAVRFREGAEAALAAARERYPVALVTNGGANTQGAKLDRLGIRDAFDEIVFCDPAAGIEPKPDPAPFERALSALGTRAERTLVVGDSLGADVAGAHAVGMQSAWVPTASPPSDPEPDPSHVLESMTELRELF